MNLFYILFGLYISFAAYILLRFPLGYVVIWLNKRHNLLAHLFFKIVTRGGESYLYALAAFMAWWYKGISIWPFLVMFGADFLLVQSSKHIFLKHLRRPRKILEAQNVALKFVPGIKTHGYRTFPSGHTTTAFAIANSLSHIFMLPWLSVLMFVYAGLVGTSRMYLVQHFFRDVFFGSIIGFLIAEFIYYLMIA